MDTTLEKVYQFADDAHADQLRKYCPDRYMVHPRRVMELCKPIATDITMLAAALLHDVLEDTPVTKAELSIFLTDLTNIQTANKILKLVVELTDIYIKATYPQLNRKERKTREAKRMQSVSPEAQTLKYADILDNCREIVLYDRQFAPRFLQECRQLLQVMDKGDDHLRNQALKVVEDGLKSIRHSP